MRAVGCSYRRLGGLSRRRWIGMVLRLPVLRGPVLSGPVLSGLLSFTCPARVFLRGRLIPDALYCVCAATANCLRVRLYEFGQFM